MTESSGLRMSAGWFGQVIAWFVISAVAAMLVVAVLIPRMGGAIPYTILTGSMEPDLPVGSLAVVKPADIGDILIGDVVTYQITTGKDTVATHRVIGKFENPAGEPQLLTKGDANSSPDSETVTQAQVKGKLWYQVPYLGRVNTLIDNAQRHTITVVIVAGLLIYASFMFAGSTRDRIASRRSKDRIAEGEVAS